MKSAIRIGALFCAALALLAVAGATIGLGWRAWRQHQIERFLALASPNSIRDARYVIIGGIPQWISIRGENKNPVILFLHGGPGNAQSGQTALFRKWEHDFTIIQWDQRGGGMTFAAGARLTPDIPMERMVGDGIEVAEYVRKTLGVGKMVLLGHSWGSVLGVHMVKKRPDLFSAYVGTGQVMNASQEFVTAYASTLSQAQAAHDDSDIEMLRGIGPPPYSSPEDLARLLLTRNHYLSPSDAEYLGFGRKSGIRTMITSPELSLGEALMSIDGTLTTAASLDIYPPLARADLPALGCDFQIPFFIIEGDSDKFTFTTEAKRYFNCIRAPQKEFILIPGGHFAAMMNADAFLEALKVHVRPFAVR